MKREKDMIPARPPKVEQFVDQFLTAVCERSRRHILECLSLVSQEDGFSHERSAGEIAELLGLATSTTSEHLKFLVSMQVLTSRKQGKMVYYRLRNQEVVQTFRGLLETLEAHYQRNLLPPPAQESGA